LRRASASGSLGCFAGFSFSSRIPYFLTSVASETLY
jgi:hypothetical protein